MYKATYTLLFVLICISCSDKKESNIIAENNTDGEHIIVDGSFIADSVDVSEMIEYINIVPIIEPEENIIGGIEKVYVTGDYYIIFDPYYSQSVVIYDEKGNFVKNLKPIGAGPDEILDLSDAWINEKGNLELYDYTLQKILIFNSDFDVTKVIHAKHPQRYRTLKKFPSQNKYVAFAGYNGLFDNGNYYSVTILDSLLNLQSVAFQYNASLQGAFVSIPLDPFSVIEDTIRFSRNFDPNIYSITPDGEILKKYELDYPHNPLPKDFEGDILMKNLKILKAQEINFDAIRNIYLGYTGFRSPWVETKDYSIFNSFDKDQQPFSSIYNKRDNKIVFQGRIFFDSSEYKMTIPPHFYATKVNENRFISVLEGYQLLNLLSKNNTFIESIEEQLDSFFIIDVKFK
jgi:hypothetical protein